MEHSFSQFYRTLAQALCPTPAMQNDKLIKTKSMMDLHQNENIPKWPLYWVPPTHLRVPWYDYNT